MNLLRTILKLRTMILQAEKIDFKKIKKTPLVPKREVKAVIKSFEANEENRKLLERCRLYYDSLYEFRRKRKRCRDYHEGKQWNDTIYSSEHKRWMTEEEYIKLQGRVPLKQNRIREKVKSVVGQWRNNDIQSIVMSRSRENAEASEIMSNALQYVLQFNQMDELDARNFVEFLLSGAAIWRSCFRWVKERNMNDVFSEMVNPGRIFFNTDLEDFRLTDLRLIGQLIDASPNDILAAFASNKQQEEEIREIYRGYESKEVNTRGMSSSNFDSINFNVPQLGERWRLIEAWELKKVWRMYVWDPLVGEENIYDLNKKQLEAINAERIKYGLANGMEQVSINAILLRYEEKLEQVWWYKFLTPEGYCLAEGESNYEHQEHPFTMIVDPLIDGEIWGYVYDFIDQQRYINRLTILMDWIIGSSSKGVLMVHKDALGDQNPDDFAKKWTEFNSVIVFEGKPGTPLPQQIATNSTNIGITELIAMQMQYMDGISGVHPAIQGAQAPSGTPGNRYAMEAQNATLNSVDLMKKFLNAKQNRDLKLIKLIKQYYKEERYLAIAGIDYRNVGKVYDPEKVKNVEFDYAVTQGNNSALFRQAADEILLELLRGQLITLETYLENSSMPFADKLLDSVKKKQSQVEQGQIPAPMAQELTQDVNNMVSPQKQAILNQALGKTA